MPTTLVTIASPMSFVIDSTAASYPLFTVNVTTGVVTSTILNADTTHFLTEKVQKVTAADPTIVGANVASVARSLFTLKQAEGPFTSSFSNVGALWTLALTGLSNPSHMLVSNAFSTDSPFDEGNDLAGIPPPPPPVVPGGVNTSVQFNDGGSFGGNNRFIYDKTTNTLTLGGNISIGFPPGTTHIVQNDGVVLNISQGATNGTNITLWVTSNGTLAAPTASLNNDQLAVQGMIGYGSDNVIDGDGAAAIAVFVDGAPTPAYVPGLLIFATKPQGGAGSPQPRMFIRGDGFVGVNAFSRVEDEIFGVLGNALIDGALYLPNQDNSGTPGNVTIDRPTGRAAIDTGSATVTVLNTFVEAGDTVMVTALGRDATCRDLIVDSVGAGTFDVSGVAAATAPTPFMFAVIKATP